MMTWEDIRRAALYCPRLQAAVTRVDIGDALKEEALIDVAIALADDRLRLLNDLARHLAQAPAQLTVI